MARVLTEDQEKFAFYAWALAQHRAALVKQLDEVNGLTREAVRLAERYGVRQKTLAELTGYTPARISQIVNDGTPTTGKTMLDTVSTWRAAIEEPQEHLARLGRKSTREQLEDWEEKYRLIYNQDSGVL